MLQKTTNGNLLKVTAGDLAKECCCGFVPTRQCSGGTQPSIVLSVSGHSTTVNWCGEQWTVEEQGVEKEVCPTNYRRIASGTLFSEKWTFQDTAETAESLKVQRALQNGLPRRDIIIFWKTTALTLAQRKTDSIFTQFGFSTFSKFEMGVLPTNATLPQTNDYLVLDSQFGSYVAVGGVTFSWSRGTNW